MQKPIIGVLPLYDDSKESYWMLPGYMQGIEAAGGIPVMLPLTTDESIIERFANQFDGFLFTGGHDVDPALYGEAVAPYCGDISSERDEMEKILFEYVLELDKPMFGICRGLQIFNVLLGGTLYQDLPTEWGSEVNHKQKPPYTEPIHNVSIEPNSMLQAILQMNVVKVNSYHHQGIKDLSNQLMPVATAPDGLIEAVVMPEKEFVLAVQWHPEFSYKHDSFNFKLFTAFIEACERVIEENEAGSLP